MSQFLPDIRYGADPRQSLDLFLPAAGDARLLFFIHGGGWRGGDKTQYRPIAEVLVNFGYAVALPNHRLAPAASHPAQLEDVAAALGWVLRDAAGAGIRTQGICLAGHSSGAHLASLLALHPRSLRAQGVAAEQIAGVVAISGIYDLTRYQGLATEYLAAVFGTDSATYREASPLTHVRAPAPPVFLAYAERDYPGAGDQAEIMAAALERAGGRAPQLCVAGRDHASILTGVRSMFDPLALHLAMFLRSIR